MKFNNIINESIPLSLVKPYLKNNKKYYDERLKGWFEGKYRVYIPVEKESETEKDLNSELEKEIEKSLDSTVFKIKDFKKGTAIDTKNNREIKLGKVLNKIKQKDLLDRFNSSEQRTGVSKKGLLICISRHPYDILGQSYDRGWTSCKNLEHGGNNKYLKDEIFQSIIAYLIYENDKNIKKPIARVLAFPYINNKLELAYKINKKVYGSAGIWENNFLKSFEEWIYKKQGEKTGTYKLIPFIYPDNMPETAEFKLRINERFETALRDSDFKELEKAVKEGADVNMDTDYYDYPPVFKVILNLKFELADLMFQKGAVIQKNDPFEYFLRNGEDKNIIQIFNYLLLKGFTIDKNYHFLEDAIDFNKLNAVKYFIKNKTDINYRHPQTKESILNSLILNFYEKGLNLIKSALKQGYKLNRYDYRDIYLLRTIIEISNKIPELKNEINKFYYKIRFESLVYLKDKLNKPEFYDFLKSVVLSERFSYDLKIRDMYILNYIIRKTEHFSLIKEMFLIKKPDKKAPIDLDDAFDDLMEYNEIIEYIKYLDVDIEDLFEKIISYSYRIENTILLIKNYPEEFKYFLNKKENKNIINKINFQTMDLKYFKLIINNLKPDKNSIILENIMDYVINQEIPLKIKSEIFLKLSILIKKGFNISAEYKKFLKEKDEYIHTQKIKTSLLSLLTKYP